MSSSVSYGVPLLIDFRACEAASVIICVPVHTVMSLEKISTYQAEKQGQIFRQERPLKVKGLASRTGILNKKLLLNSAL